jgi:hypothetical protein
MQSRLLKQLDAAIDAAGNPVKADCLRAERACLMARHGHFDEARKTLTGLQQQYALQPHMALSAWISLAEGLIAHYGKLGSAEAVDKIHRAYAMSGAARESALHALCSAWLAHLDYVRHDFASMARRVAETLRLADAKASCGTVAHQPRDRADLPLRRPLRAGPALVHADPPARHVRGRRGDARGAARQHGPG